MKKKNNSHLDIKKKSFILFVFFIVNSCDYPELESDQVIYENDFETNNLDKIDGGNIMNFNNSNVIGNYNNDGFTIHINEVDAHDYIFVTFDLYVHGSWDGNANGFKENDKPDKWILELKPEMDLYADETITKFETTFSNSPCWPNYCLKQSYPDRYPTNNNPKTGILKENLPVVCESNFFGGPTTLYKIEKTFKSSGKVVILRFYDELYQPNAIDKDGKVQQKCDESWSIDNIKIRAVNYK